MLLFRAAFISLALSLVAMPASAAELLLLMFEQPGCAYCAQWNAEVSPEYPKTTEGKAAPLVRRQLADGVPDGISLVSAPVFTPTFVLVQDGAEIGRIEGYPGEDFFWGLLDGMLKDAGVTLP